MKPLFILVVLVMFAGCSDASMSAIGALGRPHSVKCYSGGQLIYDGHSTGKINNEEHSDGYYFQEAITNKLVTVSADCLIVVE